MEHDVVAQTRRAVDADQDAVLDGGAEAHRQPVRPRARPLVIGPRVRDQPASFAEDVGGARCGKTRGKAVKHEATWPPGGVEVKKPAEERSEEITNVAKILNDCSSQVSCSLGKLLERLNQRKRLSHHLS